MMPTNEATENLNQNKQPPQSALDEVFSERDRVVTKEDQAPKTEPSEREPQSQDEIKKDLKQAETSTENKPQDAHAVKDEDNSDIELDKLKQELEKTKKALLENQKWGRSNSQKLKMALKKVQGFMEEGTLSEEEAKAVLTLANMEIEEGSKENEPQPLNPAQKILAIANQELENIRKYTDDALLDKKVRAFDFFLNTASEIEVGEAMEELTDLQDNPVKLAKRMLSIGQQYYDDVYKDFEESGGFKQYSEKKNSEIEKLQRKIDKLEKKVSQYAEYDKSTFRIDELSDSDKFQAVKARSAFDEAVAERDSVRR